jgi:hypothetical protein
MLITPDNEEYPSWIESRRLIISQLAVMESSIRDLSLKIDRYGDSTRERNIEMAKEAQMGLADLNLRVAMLELRAKLWGAMLGLFGGGVATEIIQLIGHGVSK